MHGNWQHVKNLGRRYELRDAIKRVCTPGDASVEETKSSTAKSVAWSWRRALAGWPRRTILPMPTKNSICAAISAAFSTT